MTSRLTEQFEGQKLNGVKMKSEGLQSVPDYSIRGFSHLVSDQFQLFRK